MKNFKKLLVISSFCITSLTSAQSGAYDHPTKHSSDQSSWSNWFTSDDKAPSVPDEVITSTVTQNLKNTPYFSNFAKNIQVVTKDGKVTLNGHVANRNEKNQIEYMVKNVDGVREISNELQDEKALSIPDELITSRVIQNLRNTPYFSNFAKNIRVITKEGKVTLKGRVADKNEKVQIEYMVKNVDGVKSVSNDLESEK